MKKHVESKDCWCKPKVVSYKKHFSGRKDFGKYLKKLRQDKGLAQVDVSEKMYFSTPQMLSNIERGLCYPSLTILKVMSNMYRVDLKELVSDMYCSKCNDAWNKLGI